MSYLILGFLTGLSLIIAIGAQNIFVIEQGLKKQFVFLVCFICTISDIILIFFGIFIFYFFQKYFTPIIEFIFNILLILFLIYFIWKKFNEKITNISLNLEINQTSRNLIIFRTLGFTYLNPHVYSDTVFFLGNFSKDFLVSQKIFFGAGASIASIIFFFSLGYLSKIFSKYINTPKIWRVLNYIIIIFMIFIIFFVLKRVLFLIQ